MIKIRKISDISELTVPQNGYVTMYVDKDEKFKAVITDVVNPKIQTLSSNHQEEQDYLRPINCILVDKKKLISISEASKKVGYRAFCLTEFSIFEWNGESWIESPLKNKTAIAQYLEINNSIIIWNNNKHYISLSTSDHVTNYRNPHSVTKEDVGLGEVINEKQADPEQWNTHTNNTNNPHSVTKEDVGLGEVINVKSVSEDQWTSHVENQNNPHKVTKEDVGLSSIENIHHVSQRDLDEHTHDMDAILEDLGLGNIKNITQADYIAVDRHVRDYNNPHKVRKEDIGLDQVENVCQYESSQFNNHTSDVNNPHGITKEDIGLGSVLEGERLISQDDFNEHKTTHNPHRVTKEDIGLESVLNIPSVSMIDYNSHLIIKNPHGVTKEDIGLGNVSNIILVPLSEYEMHVNAHNPHRVTKEDIGLGNVENVRQLLKNEYEMHVNAHNPHQVTKEQIGLSLVKNIRSASKPEVNDHINNIDNPHQVTKEQIGLGNVANVADIDYPITEIYKTLLDQYVEKTDDATLGIIRDYRRDYPENSNLFKRTIFPMLTSSMNMRRGISYINPKMKYFYDNPLIIFLENKHGVYGEKSMGNDISSIIEYNISTYLTRFNNYIPLHDSSVMFGLGGDALPSVTTQRTSRLQDSIKKFFLNSAEQKSNFNHHRVGSFDSKSRMSYVYDTKNSGHMIRLDQYNDTLSYYHNNPLNTFCDPTKTLFTQEGNIIGIPRINSNFLLLIDMNKSGHNKYKYVSYNHYGRITNCYIQVVKNQPTLNRIVIIERNDDYNKYVIKSILINHANVHANVLNGGLTDILTLYTSDILKYYVSSEGIQYVLDGRCMNYSFNTKAITEFTYSNNKKFANANEFYQYGDYYFVLHSNYKKLSILKKETNNTKVITEYSLEQNFGINELSWSSNLLKIVTEHYIFVIKNEDWNHPSIIYKGGSYHVGSGFVMLTYNTTLDTTKGNLYKITNQDPFIRVLQEKLFDNYDSVGSLERNANIKSFIYNDTSIDISTTDVVCMLNKKDMQLVIIHLENDPDKLNDPIRFEKYNNQEFIGVSKDALSYYHNSRLITIGHDNNYNEAVIAGNPLQSLSLDDSIFDKFICREKDKTEICQTLNHQSTMLNEYEFRLISDLPVQNVQKIVTIDYEGDKDINNNEHQPISVRNGMLILYDGGKMGYYDWNLNSLVEKEKSSKWDNHMLYKDQYQFPYIKDENITDIQSDFKTTVIVATKNGKKVLMMAKSYANGSVTTDETSNVDAKILGKLYNKISILYGGNLWQINGNYNRIFGENNISNIQYLKDGIYNFSKMKKYNASNRQFTSDIDFIIPTIQSKDNLVAIKEVLNGYLLIQIGGEVEVTYNKWMVDFGMATTIPDSISRKPTFDYRE